MTLKIIGNLPGDDANGLIGLGDEMLDNPTKVHAVLMLIDCKLVETDQDSGATTVKARIRRAERIRRDDLPTAEKLVRRALEGRSGGEVLPMELEDEITAAFSDIDPRTGEIRGE